jgi:hypothetical protein
MDKQCARDILENLVLGLNPVTGDTLPDDHLFCQPDVTQAIWVALRELRQSTKQTAPARMDALMKSIRSQPNTPKIPQAPSPSLENTPARKGARWTPEEDDFLVRAFGGRMDDKSIALQLSRTRYAIINRLRVLDLIDMETCQLLCVEVARDIRMNSL